LTFIGLNPVKMVRGNYFGLLPPALRKQNKQIKIIIGIHIIARVLWRDGSVLS
jgi:hypothetical protein